MHFQALNLLIFDEVQVTPGHVCSGIKVAFDIMSSFLYHRYH